MTSHPQQKILIVTAIIVTAVISLIACTEKPADSNQAEKSVSTIAGDKIAELQREAQEGDADAQYELAFRYENGLGVAKNEAMALELYQQAADQGHPAAQDNLDAMSKSK